MKRFRFFALFGLLFFALPASAATARKAEVYFVRYGVKNDAICALDIVTQHARVLWQAQKRIFGLAANADASQFTFSMDSNPEPSREQLAKAKWRTDLSKFDVYILTRRGNRLRNVTAGAKNLNCFQSEFVPLQNWLTFMGRNIKDGRRHIYVVKTDGSQMETWHERGAQEDLTWSFDGQSVAWLEHTRSSVELMITRDDDRRVRALTRDRFKDAHGKAISARISAPTGAASFSLLIAAARVFYTP